MPLVIRPGFKLRKKEHSPRPGKGTRLSFEFVEKIFELYCAEHSAREISEQTGVSTQAIYRYIDKGDGKRGIAPLKHRRAAIVAAIQRKHDNAIIDSAVRTRAVAASAIEAIGARVIERVKNASILEDEALYGSENTAKVAAAKARAYNPKPGDLKAVLDASANLEKVHAPTTAVHVSQTQTQQQDQEAHADEIDFVRDNVKNIQQCMGSDEREAIAKLVRGVSLASESPTRLRNGAEARAAIEGSGGGDPWGEEELD